MKITIHMIRDYLGECVIKQQIHADRSIGMLEAVSIFDPKLTISPDRIYIVESKYISSFKTVRYEGAFIFLDGAISKDLEHVPNDYLVLQEKNAVWVLQKVQLLFEKYCNWEVALYKAAAHKSGIKNIAMTAASLIENPFFLYTASLKLVFCCNLTERAESFFQELEDYDDQVEGEYVTDDFLDILRDDPRRWQMIFEKEPGISGSEKLGYRTLYYNIFLGGVYAARLLICEAEHQLKDSDFFVLKTLGDFLAPFLEREDISINAHPANFDKYIQCLLAGEPVEETALRTAMEAFGWHIEDKYFCCYIPMDTLMLTTDIVMSACVFLEASCPSSALITFNDHIIHIINLTDLHDKRERVQQSLIRLYHEKRLRAGSSPEFTDIRKLADRFRQAEVAYRLGSKCDPETEYFMYENYDLRDLIQVIKQKYSLEAIRPEELGHLMEYDEANNMHLMKTLKVYLEHDRNIAKSIRVLYMQRATFLYQLKRIVEITGLDLDEYSTRLYLQIYFMVEEVDHLEE